MQYPLNKKIHFFIFGFIYTWIEVFSRALSGDLVGYNNISYLSFMGYTSLWMFPIGGICGILIGYLNDKPSIYSLKIYIQILIGGTLITLVELFTGIFFNIYLGLNLWYYNDTINFLHQICLRNTILWYILITPLIIWMDDQLTYYIYNEGELYNIFEIYKKLLTNK